MESTKLTSEEIEYILHCISFAVDEGLPEDDLHEGVFLKLEKMQEEAEE